MEKISIDDLKKVEITIGQIVEAVKIEGSDKLLKLTVDVGEGSTRTILSGIAKFFPDPSVLVGVKCPFVTNLKPREMMGMESNGMLFAVSSGDKFSLLGVSNEIPVGSKLS